MKRLWVQESSGRKDPKDISQIHSTVFHAITTFIDLHHPGLTIFPKLIDLWCFDLQHDSFWEIIPYLSPSIQAFELFHSPDFSSAVWHHPELYQLEQPSVSAVALLSALTTKAPSIRVLRVLYDYVTHAVPVAYPCRFLHLTTFHFLGIPLSNICDTIEHLACLSNLHDVSLYLWDRNPRSLSAVSLPAVPFPSLRTLEPRSESFGIGVEFVSKCLISAMLSSFTLYAKSVPSTGQSHQLFSALASCCHHQSMTSLHVEVEDPGPVGPALQLSDLKPLLQFNNLEFVEIEINCSPEHLSDSFVDSMTIAWPRLTRLHIGHLGLEFAPSSSQCTLEGILLLAKRCPKLQFLTFPFLASAEITWNDRPGDGVVNESLERLDVGRSPIEDPHMVASFLSDVFPNLICFDAWDGYGLRNDQQVRYHKLWEEAITLYERFKGNREKGPGTSVEICN
jgi:hypothetical protein